MSRTHIHLAPGLPGDGNLVSGMRQDCELAIFIDLRRALSDGIPFFWSANKVILTPGNESGLLPPSLFQRVVQLKPNRRLLSLDGAEDRSAPREDNSRGQQCD
uniref:tRNA 2'-phosphotransferase 1 n=1 Tax=Callorhinchus milii TaxID=7868 RepID=V9LC56_CALMI